MPKPFFAFILRYRYAIIFPVAVIEGPIVTMLSGFLVSLGYLSLIPTYILLLSGDLISDSLFYLLGRFGRDFLARMKSVRLSEERLEKLEEHYENHPRKTIIVAKISYGVGSFFLAAAGASKMAYGKFFEYVSIPNAVRTLVLLLVGFYFGSAWRHFGIYLRDYAIMAALLLALGYFIWFSFRKREAKFIERAIVKAGKKPFS